MLQPPVGAQLPSAPGDRYAGLQWRFVRIRYHYHGKGSRFERDFSGELWYIHAAAAEQNLSRRVKTATAIHVEDPIMLALGEPRIPTGARRKFDRPAEVAGHSALDTLLKRRAVLERQLEEVKAR